MVSQNLDSEFLTYKHGAATATGESPDSCSDTPGPGEDVKDEIVDDPNVIAEVKLLGNSH